MALRLPHLFIRNGREPPSSPRQQRRARGAPSSLVDAEAGADAITIPRTSAHRGDGFLLLDLPDDAISLTLYLLSCEDALAAISRCSVRLRRLACEPALWHALLTDRLNHAHWRVPPAALCHLAWADAASLLKRGAWRLPRLAADAMSAPGSPDASPAVRPSQMHAAAFSDNPMLIAAAAAAAASSAIHALPEAYLAPLPQIQHLVAPTSGGGGSGGASAPGGSSGIHRFQVTPDGLSVRYVGDRLGGNRAVRCEPPLPRAPFDTLRWTRASGSGGGERLRLFRACCVAYYEVTLRSSPRAASTGPGPMEPEVDCVAVGLASAKFPLTGRQPGWDSHSYGYHSDDGRVFHNSGTRSTAFGPRFGPGDTVGCGYSLATRQVFYTHNGAFLGVAYTAKPATLPLYPVVGIDSHAAVHFNFGQAPFLYDLDELPPYLTAPPKPLADPAASPVSALRQWALALTRSASF